MQAVAISNVDLQYLNCNIMKYKQGASVDFVLFHHSYQIYPVVCLCFEKKKKKTKFRSSLAVTNTVDKHMVSTGERISFLL